MVDSIKEELAKNLLYYRKIRKITQKELAEKLGVKHNTISGWENGANSIDVEILFNICQILDISINDIYGKYALLKNNLLNNEKEIIKKYRALDERGKQTIDMALNSQYEIIVAKKETTALPEERKLPLVAEEPVPYNTDELAFRKEMHRRLDDELDAAQKGQTSPALKPINGLDLGEMA